MTKIKDIQFQTELLAPAGSFEGLKAVIEAGADAVYIGGAKYGARAYADNPDEKGMIEAIDYAHLHGVRIYLTVNTLIKENELQDMLEFVYPYVIRGLDGILVQDFGAMKALHETYPDLPLHASTQMTVSGPEGARLLKKYGISRVVPAREMTIKELKKIHDESGLEVEAFIHGALCYCYSGQCLMSSVIGGRSGNRGRCAQPCRLPYQVNGKQGRLLSPKDLCTLDHIPELVDAGVVSYKIEGRMKQPSYAAGVVSVYRKYLDLYQKNPTAYKVDEKDRQLLFDLYNREGFTDGYLKKHNGKDMMAFRDVRLEGNHTEAVYDEMKHLYVDKQSTLLIDGVAIVKEGLPLKLILNYKGEKVIAEGQVVEAAQNRPLAVSRIEEQLNKTGGSGLEFNNLKIIADDHIFLPVSAINNLRRKAFDDLKTQLLSKYLRMENDPSEKKLYASEKNRLTLVQTEKINMSVSCENMNQLEEIINTDAIDLIYHPIQRLMELSKNERQKLFERIHKKGKKIYGAMPYMDRLVSDFHNFGENSHNKALEFMEEGMDGVLVRSLETFACFIELGKGESIRCDASLYAWNRKAAEFLRENKVSCVTAPYELSSRELREIKGYFDEIVVYGRIPVMISAQCVQKNTSKCTQRPSFLYMEDRTRRKLLVKNECTFCYNVIYNSVPLSLLRDIQDIKRNGTQFVRLSFTDEDPEAVRKICEEFKTALESCEKIKDKGEHTRGHYVRGVE